MTLYPINSGNFKLDGGAMFGVVPKSIWQKTNPADSGNMIDIAARCLLVEDGNRLILMIPEWGISKAISFLAIITFGEMILSISHSKKMDSIVMM